MAERMTAVRRPLRLGVWIEAVPDVDLRGEGIARTLAAVLRSLANRPDTELTVALARWNEAGFRGLLDDWRIPQSSVTVIVSRPSEPLIVRLRRRGPARLPLTTRIRNAVRRFTAAPGVHRLAGRIIGVSSWPVALLVGLVALAAAILAVPLVVLGAIVLGIAGLAFALGRRLQRPLRHATGRALIWSGIVRRRMRDWFSHTLLDNEFRILAERVRRTAEVDVWFVPHPGATHAAKLNAPLVVAVPDLLYLDFPTLYPPEWATRVDRQALSLLTRAAATISYSDDVAARHAVAHSGIDAQRAYVIPHAPFDSGSELDSAAAPDDRDRRATAARLIRMYLEDRLHARGGRRRFQYHVGVPFDEVTYFFVASQVRASKNYLNLFRAYRTLVREQYSRTKLVITGDISRDGALNEYVRSERLDLDILSVPNLPSRVHSAFMHLAALTVVPTLFEGGFPFPFSESLSVGTPVLMSDIRATRPHLPETLAEVMLFDPYDVSSIVDRLTWGLDHRAELLRQQQPFHAMLKARNWDMVAGEYRSVFERAANQAGR